MSILTLLDQWRAYVVTINLRRYSTPDHFVLHRRGRIVNGRTFSTEAAAEFVFEHEANERLERCAPISVIDAATVWARPHDGFDVELKTSNVQSLRFFPTKEAVLDEIKISLYSMGRAKIVGKLVQVDRDITNFMRGRESW